MQLELVRTKILRATVTDVQIDYEGSLAIDTEFLEQVGLLPYEKILVGNITNGERFDTYAIPAPAGSKTFSLNGAAGHKGSIGDLIVLMSFARMSEEEARTHAPRVLVLADKNERILELRNGIPAHPNPLT